MTSSLMDDAQHLTTPPPPGFLPAPGWDRPIFNQMIGPFWVKPEGEGIVYGLRAELHHCNPTEVLHGGMLMAFADVVLTGGSNYVAKLSRFLLTVSLTADFMAPAPIGSWLEARPEVLKVTRTLVFSQCLITADGKPVLRASGTLHAGGQADPRFDRMRSHLKALAEQGTAQGIGKAGGAA